MHIEQSEEYRGQRVESELRQVKMKIEAKTLVLEYSSEKFAHYLSMTERLRVELRDLAERKRLLEKQLHHMAPQSIN